MKLAPLATLAHGRLEQAADDTVDIHDVMIAAQDCDANTLFAAVPGTRAHGAQFAADSAAGAILTDAEGERILAAAGDTRPRIIVDSVRPILGHVSAAVYGDPTAELTIIGMTGTSGKTTTSYLIEAALLAQGLKVGLIGTTGTRINGQPVPTSLTTPEAPTLQRLFATMVAEGVTHVVMEVSSHAISLGRVGGTRFAVQGFSNLSQDHLDFHHSMEEYFQAKAQWFDNLDPSTSPVILLGDTWAHTLATTLGDAALGIAFDTAEAPLPTTGRFTVSHISADPTGSHNFTFTDTSSGHATDVTIHLPGRFNVNNAALALGCLAAIGMDIDACARAMGSVAVPGRMERIDCGQPYIAVVDYAHKPAAVAAVLASLRRQITGRIGIVVGAGGDRDAGKRPLMGAEAAQGAELVIITDDNPRSEDPATIRAAVEEGARTAAADTGRDIDIRVIADRAEAIRAAVDWAHEGDAIIIAGKGHETGQLINGVTHPFDDREQLRAAITSRHN